LLGVEWVAPVAALVSLDGGVLDSGGPSIAVMMWVLREFMCT
jgi:hypothetical protein